MSGAGRWIAAGGALVAVAAVAVAVTTVVRSGAGAQPRPPTPPGAPVQWVSSSHALTVGRMDRRYLLVRPAAPSPTPLPVVVVLHGRVATPELEAQRTGFSAVTGPAILVYPAGYQNSWNAGACCAGAHDAGVDDVAFITAALHDVLATQPDAAPRQVFLVGFSNGGKMAFRLVCAEPQLFSAVAVVGAVPVSDCPQPPALPFAEVAIHDDPLLTLTPAQPPKLVNGYRQVSIEGEVAALRAANGCPADGPSQVRGTLTATRFDGCRTDKPVELDLYQGTAHLWPAGDATTPAAQRVIWDFFRSITEDHR